MPNHCVILRSAQGLKASTVQSVIKSMLADGSDLLKKQHLGARISPEDEYDRCLLELGNAVASEESGVQLEIGSGGFKRKLRDQSSPTGSPSPGADSADKKPRGESTARFSVCPLL